MDDVLGWILAPILWLMGAVILYGMLKKTLQQFKGQSRCVYCKKGLRGQTGTGYAGTCHHCGQIQPWDTPEGRAAQAEKSQQRAETLKGFTAKLEDMAESQATKKERLRAQGLNRWERFKKNSW